MSDWNTLGQQLWNGTLNGAIYVIFASGLSLVFGVMRVVNMAHGELAMVGAMIAYAATGILGLPLLFALGAGVLGAGAIGALTHQAAMRPYVPERELTVIVSTLGVSLVLLHGGVTTFGSEPRAIRLSFDRLFEFAGVQMTVRGLIIIVLSMTSMLALHVLLQHTGMGHRWQATAQNALGAQLIGIDTRRVFRQTMVIAAMLAGASGILLAILNSARPDMGQSLLLTGFAVVIVAGMGSIAGALVVGLSMGLVEALFAQYVSSELRQVFIYGVMVIALLVKPQGLFRAR